MKLVKSMRAQRARRDHPAQREQTMNRYQQTRDEQIANLYAAATALERDLADASDAVEIDEIESDLRAVRAEIDVLETSYEQPVERCTCAMYDDGDGESGPHLVVDVVETCAIHGRTAEPERWSESDAEAAAFDAFRLITYRSIARRERPGLYDASLIERAARQMLDDEDAHAEREHAAYLAHLRTSKDHA